MQPTSYFDWQCRPGIKSHSPSKNTICMCMPHVAHDINRNLFPYLEYLPEMRQWLLPNLGVIHNYRRFKFSIFGRKCGWVWLFHHGYKNYLVLNLWRPRNQYSINIKIEIGSENFRPKIEIVKTLIILNGPLTAHNIQQSIKWVFSSMQIILVMNCIVL